MQKEWSINQFLILVTSISILFAQYKETEWIALMLSVFGEKPMRKTY